MKAIRYYYQYCSVPSCLNNTNSTPNKLFIPVPQNEDMRKKWMQLAGRDWEGHSIKSGIHFCEDHFDLPNCMENYMQYRIQGYIKKIRMNVGCLPTKFDCQPDRKEKAPSSTYIANTKIILAEEALRDESNKGKSKNGVSMNSEGKDNSAKINASTNRQITNLDKSTNTLPQDIKTEPDTTLAMDNMDIIENCDTGILPYITQVKSEAVNLDSDDEMSWDRAIGENRIGGKLITGSKEVEKMNKIRDMYEPLIDIIEGERACNRKMSWETSTDEKTVASNAITDKRKEQNQFIEITQVDNPLINTFKIENSCDNEILWEAVMDDNIAMDAITKGNEIQHTNKTREMVKKACDSINRYNRVLEDSGTAKLITKKYVLIKTATKNKEGNRSNLSLQHGIDNAVLIERKEGLGFSDKSTPMCITKVTSDEDTIRNSATKLNPFSLQNQATEKIFLPVEDVKLILNRVVEKLAVPNDSTEALEVAHLINLVSLEYKRLLEFNKSMEIKNGILNNKLQYLQTNLMESKCKMNSMKKHLSELATPSPLSYKVAYEIVTTQMEANFEKLFEMQMRLAMSREKRFTKDEKKFALELFECGEKAYKYMSNIIILPRLKLIRAWRKRLPKSRKNTLKSEGKSRKKKAVKPKRTKKDKTVNVNKSKTELDNVSVKSVTDKENKTTKTSTDEIIDFEDQLECEKFVIKKEGKDSVNNGACLLADEKLNYFNDWTISNLNEPIKSDETATDDLLVPILKRNDRSDSYAKSYKASRNRAAAEISESDDSEKTVSVCEDEDIYVKNIEDKVKNVKLAARKRKMNANKSGVKNQAATNRVKRLKRKINTKYVTNVKIGADDPNAIVAHIDTDNVGKKRRYRKEIAEEININDLIDALETSRRQSSRLALKRTHVPQGEDKT